ncbi:hypothetical protein [Streptomyces sp. NPDC046261]|uniref:hypothetical protein n=1 Tax=Streptomyces sp. NPDC046261 TaxID=3157200 RepID=UPI0033FEB535
MSALSPRRRSALRAVVASAALASAVLAPATAAFAAEPAAPAPVAPAAPAAKAAEQATGTTTPAAPAGTAQKSGEAKTQKTEKTETSGAGKKTEAGTQTEPEKKDAATQTDADKGEGKGDGKTDAVKKCSDEQVYGTWCLVRSTTLPDGTPVNVYSRGTETHRADIMSGTTVVKSVTASGNRDARFTYNGMSITLTALRGDLVTKTLDDYVYVGMEKLPQGGVVRVYKVGPNHYQGRIARGEAAGAALVIFDADGEDGYAEYKGQRVRLGAADGAVTVQVMAGPSGTTQCTATIEANIGAGTIAVLTNGPKGPQVRYKDGSGDISGVIMDREHPSDGRTGKIVDPDGAHPRLVTKMQGGDYPSVTTDFPVAPEGCGATGAKATGSTGGAAKATNASTQPGSAGVAQTKAVPQGGVAAGAEGVREDNETALLAAGGALASVGAAGVAFAVLRRRAVGV